MKDFNFRDAIEAMLAEESKRYVPHTDTCRMLSGLQINPELMGGPLVLSKKNADLFIQAGMHLSDIVVVERIQQFAAELPDQQVVERRRGKGERKAGRNHRWGGSAIL